jgi:DNA-binding CsgD family transcriptional regulator
MFTAAELLPLIEAIYAGIVDQAAWEAALLHLCKVFDGEVALLVLSDSEKMRVRTTTFVQVDPKFRDAYLPLAEHPDLRGFYRSFASYAHRGALTGSEIAITATDFVRSRFHEEWLRAQRIGDYIAAPLVAAPTAQGALNIGRRQNRHGFGSREVDALRLLRPHLLRACQARLRLEDAQHQASGALAALDRIEQGVILVDAHAAVVHANRAADAMLTRNDGLVAARAILACDHPDDTAALRRAIGTASERRTEGSGGSLALRRRSGRRPLSVLVAPLRTGEPAAPGRAAAAMVMVRDPEATVAAPADGLRAAYGLTAAEARTAAALLDHGHLAEVAEDLGISLATVRTLLQRAFDKTGTHSQAELVRLMLAHRLPAARDLAS